MITCNSFLMRNAERKLFTCHLYGKKKTPQHNKTEQHKTNKNKTKPLLPPCHLFSKHKRKSLIPDLNENRVFSSCLLENI